jgi:hypothetical protein
MVSQLLADPGHPVSKQEARHAPDDKQRQLLVRSGWRSTPVNLPLLESMIRSLSRLELEELAHTLIGQLDELETGPHYELSGDEYDGSDAKDDFAFLAPTSIFGPDQRSTEYNCEQAGMILPEPLPP